MYRIPESEGLVKDDRELCLNQEQQEAAEQIFRNGRIHIRDQRSCSE